MEEYTTQKWTLGEINLDDLKEEESVLITTSPAWIMFIDDDGNEIKVDEKKKKELIEMFCGSRRIVSNSENKIESKNK